MTTINCVCGVTLRTRYRTGTIECSCGRVYRALTGEPVDVAKLLEHEQQDDDPIARGLARLAELAERQLTPEEEIAYRAGWAAGALHARAALAAHMRGGAPQP